MVQQFTYAREPFRHFARPRQPRGTPRRYLNGDEGISRTYPRNGFVSQRVIDKARFMYEDSHTTGEWNMLSNREHFLASKAAVRNASVSPPQLLHRVGARRKGMLT